MRKLGCAAELGCQPLLESAAQALQLHGHMCILPEFQSSDVDEAIGLSGKSGAASCCRADQLLQPLQLKHCCDCLKLIEGCDICRVRLQSSPSSRPIVQAGTSLGLCTCTFC